ncbi:Cytochrome c, mono-and diheme variants [Cognatiyoonia koreensis]|uniref:Cytochrome c, mono-and diheme variants n=2 Tax=Cognatiyoonia koreensis TaxID=364200 RepID=A0A1I0P4A5_9RHOB|nr:cytochrome c [Cognatiyoonia koreensis]SEW08343.1 Cytochrome c, mono-and diheme variants [Cognatiyoonia koreensis]
MWRRLGTGLGLLLLVGAGVGLWITQADPLPDDALAGLEGDPESGARIFAAAGCASCHIAEDGPADVLSGGKRFATDFGTFVAPNISSDPVAGVGSWDDIALANAILRGVSPDGQQYYPVFPYGAYNKMRDQDVIDLISYMRTLPASDIASQPHDIAFPFSIRRLNGGWKTFAMVDDWTLQDPASDEIAQGRYLVEALGHCAECHTPRNAIGGLDTAAWMTGAPFPAGEGRVPGITPSKLDWSVADIAEYLRSGFTPDFDSAGGEMAAVVRNTAKLTDADRQAIASYLKALPN